MGTSSTWKCPGCSAIVPMPSAFQRVSGDKDDRRLDQLAQALCGCWVARLTESGVTRLLCALMAGDDLCTELKVPTSRGGR